MSAPKRRLALRPSARSDVRSILLYTRAQWGVEQRRRYRAKLEEAMDRLTRHPELGQERNDLYHGCRALRVEQHIVYYRVTETEIVVGRVLHARQEASGRVIEP
jgi:toxin ParE1/3/4